MIFYIENPLANPVNKILECLEIVRICNAWTCKHDAVPRNLRTE